MINKKKKKNSNRVVGDNSDGEAKKKLYRIIITSQNKILVCVFKGFNKKTAIAAFEKIQLENNKKVKFPIRYSSRDHLLIESKYEILLVRSKNEDTTTPLLRNKYGRLVPHETNSDKMEIYRKEEFLFEESFWVYGFNPRSQRKDFTYILNDILLFNLPKTKEPIKSILIYRNKLLIQTNDDFDIVICKCENDAARLYTELEKQILKLKIKSVFFSGIAKGVLSARIEERIGEKTGWALKKIRRSSTRP